MTQTLPHGLSQSRGTDYAVLVPPTMSLDDGIRALEANLKEALATAPIFRERQPVETRWEGQRFEGRDLVLFNASSGYPYAVLEFDNSERGFFVRDSSRLTLTREYICDLLAQQKYVRVACPGPF